MTLQLKRVIDSARNHRVRSGGISSALQFIALLVALLSPATAGELHLALREKETLKSICHFQYPADSPRALVALIANAGKHGCEDHVVDPEKEGFVKGSLLIFNFSPHAP